MTEPEYRALPHISYSALADAYTSLEEASKVVNSRVIKL